MNKTNKIGLSIVVPVKNESANLVELVKRIHLALKKHPINYEIIGVDDYSTDDSAFVLGKLAKKYPIKIVKKSGPPGKSQSLLEGFEVAQYDRLSFIDADLQYPPEVFPEMIHMINQDKCDIVIAERVTSDVGWERDFISNSFTFIFGKILNGIDGDVQSGMKLFKRKIIERIKLNPKPWTFDLEFLVKAKNAGYKIGQVPINFAQRRGGQTKINLFRNSLEIGWEALKLAFTPKRAIPFHPDDVGQKGQGFNYKGFEFVHHSDLPLDQTAVRTLEDRQTLYLIIFSAVIIIGLLLDYKLVLIILIGILISLYFIDLLFHLFLIMRNFTVPTEIIINDNEIKNLKDKDCPRYTIFCPLYHEWQVVPQFTQAISRLDYPKNKIQVQLLLEADDLETIERVKEMTLPKYFEVIVVPNSLPKTKPKALNYGLKFATGEYSVIYDAEDIPDTLQLKKAALAFKNDKKLVCIQAKLNYYNPNQNILTRIFTAEYALWFDLILTGLQSIKAPIPLGGTSNHFQTAALRKINGWDSFNVTEDADLGMRLAKSGFQTAMFNSTTLEEANSRLGNWFNQRTRWIKGYMQTYLVHMRNPKAFLKTKEKDDLVTFQLVVGGKILPLFINPIMWLTTIVYFTFRPELGKTIESFFPGPIFYMGVISFVVGNFLYLYYYMLGCAKRGQWGLIKYAYLVPFYWLLMSVAAWKALFQLITRPHFWPKTIHGFHLGLGKEAYKPAAVKNEKKTWSWGQLVPKPVSYLYQKLASNKTWSLQTLTSGSFLLICMMVANLLNLVFNGYLGRVLSYTDFGLLTFINTGLYLLTVFTGALSATVTYKSAYLSGEEDSEGVGNFFNVMLRRSLAIGLIVSVIWFAISPFLVTYFNLSSVTPLLFFTPLIFFSIISAVNQGYLTGIFAFVSLGFLTILASLGKFLMAFVIVGSHLQSYAYLPIIFSSIFASILTYFFVWKKISFKKIDNKNRKYAFSMKFFLATCLTSLSTSIFLTVDVLLVKHFLSPQMAGEYSILSLVGKMVYFFGSMLSSFIFPMVAKDQGAHENSETTFHRLLIGSTVMTLIPFLGVGVLGKIFVPVLLGAKSLTILPYLLPYSLAITCFTIVSFYLTYYLARHKYVISIFSLIMTICLSLTIAAHHRSIGNIVFNISLVALASLIVMIVYHNMEKSFTFAYRAVYDFIDLFHPYKVAEALENRYRILIFNWRDTKHSYAGGAEVYIQELAKRWVADGNQVTIFCGNDGRTPRYEKVDDVNIVRRGGFFLVYLWAFLYYQFKFKNKFDIVIDCENGIPFFTPLYVKEKTYLLIHHVHQSVFRKTLNPILSLMATTLEIRLMPVLYRHIQFMTVSESSKQEILDHKLTVIKPVVIHNGVDLNFYKPGKKSEKPMILYLGRLQFYKSVDVLIHAAKEIINNIKDVRIVIAGDGDESGRLKKLTKKLGLEKNIEFMGKVSENIKRSLYQKAWVFVNPSYLEGWGITTIEANACGTPVVASNVAGLRDSVKNPHTGLLVPYGRSEEFAKNIMTILARKDLRKEMSVNSIEWAAQFDWKNSAQQSFDLIKSDVTEERFNQSLLSIPTVLSQIRNLILNNFINRFMILSNQPPTKVGQYLLIKSLSKRNVHHHISIGLYSKNGKKYVIKTWKNIFRDTKYAHLINEYQNIRMLAEKITDIRSFFPVCFPKLNEMIKEKNQTSLVFEYMNGRPLSSYPADMQQFTLLHILKILQTISDRLTREEINKLVKKNKFFYKRQTPFLAGYLLLYYPMYWKKIWRSFKSVMGFWKISDSELTLNHGRLDPDNIIIKNNRAYLIDVGSMTMTIKDYDLAYLLLQKNRIKKRKISGQRASIIEYLKSYITLREAVRFVSKKANSYMHFL